MPTSTLAKHGWKVLFLAIAAFYLYGLGSLPLVGPDEPRYAQVAREMLLRGDFITPTLGGFPWFEKPPLLYWMMMASYRVFGVNEFAARLGPAICGLLTAGLVYWAGKRICATDKSDHDDASTSQTLGSWSVFVCLTSLGMIVFSRGASFDIVLTMTVTGALCCFFVWRVREATKDGARWPRLLSGFYGFLGLSLLAKGLVGFVLTLGIIGAYFIVRRESPGKRFWSSFVWGIPLALAVAAVWYGPMYYRHGWTFVDQFIIQHHVARFVSNKYHHPQPFYFYLPVFALLVLPWTVVLISALADARRWQWRAASAIERLRLFSLVWIAIPLVFFSLSGSKIPGYILPVLPAAAFLIGERITSFLRAGRGEGIIRITGALLLLGSGIGMWYATQSGAGQFGWFLAAALATVAAASVALFVPRARAVSFLLVGASVILACAIGLKPAGAIAARESVRELMRTADVRGYSSAPVFFFLSDERTAEFYASGRLVYQANGEPIRFEGAQQLPPAIRAKGDVGLVIMETRWEKQLTDYKSVQTEKIGSNGLVTLFVVRPQ